MIVSKNPLLGLIYSPLQRLQFAFIQNTDHPLYILVLLNTRLVYLLEDQFSEKEGKSNGANEGNNCNPDYHGRAGLYISIDASSDHALNEHVDIEDSEP